MVTKNDDYTTSLILGGGLMVVYIVSAIIRKTRKTGKIVDETGKELKPIPPGKF